MVQVMFGVMRFNLGQGQVRSALISRSGLPVRQVMRSLQVWRRQPLTHAVRLCPNLAVPAPEVRVHTHQRRQDQTDDSHEAQLEDGRGGGGDWLRSFHSRGARLKSLNCTSHSSPRRRGAVHAVRYGANHRDSDRPARQQQLCAQRYALNAWRGAICRRSDRRCRRPPSREGSETSQLRSWEHH